MGRLETRDVRWGCATVAMTRQNRYLVGKESTWHENLLAMSSKKFLVEQAEKGVIIDKTFKRPTFIATARAVSEKFNLLCSDSNVENHLRTLKTKYSQIKRLKNMSGIGWNDTLKMITMDDDTYNEYVQALPKDEPYLNKPIEMYDEMIIICGDDQATGSFARAVSEPVVDVDARSNFGANNDESEEMKDKTKENDNASNGITKGGRKRSRNIESKFDMLIDKVGDLDSAIAKSRNRDISIELYNAVIKCEGYDESQLVGAFEYLLGNDISARSFLVRSLAMRKKWLDDYFSGSSKY
ncbi:hypothetical protein QJS10_CPA08g01087 [Acorus calamus]|uniref:Myb/SANT-like domain-containing protein n=1 Tax=Acorus calamus TaxID=4465 RepID=A0AAV9EA34_ACOCL|nr:hypothetical protein QJS10_CPA08g01087 [Acorus calamus]